MCRILPAFPDEPVSYLLNKLILSHLFSAQELMILIIEFGVYADSHLTYLAQFKKGNFFRSIIISVSRGFS